MVSEKFHMVRNSCYSQYTKWRLELVSLQVPAVRWAESSICLHCLYELSLHGPFQECRHPSHMQRLNMAVPSLTECCLWTCREETLEISEDKEFDSRAGLHSETPVTVTARKAREPVVSKSLSRTITLKVKEKLSNRENITHNNIILFLQEPADQI